MTFKLTILTFHKVVEEPYFIPPMAIRVKTFKGIVKKLNWLGRIITLSRAVEKIQNGTLKGNNFAITFDDGYLDNYEIAANILSDRSLPATFFIPFSQIDNQKIFWWDHLFFLIKSKPLRLRQWFSDLNIPIRNSDESNPFKYTRQIVQFLNGLSAKKRQDILRLLENEFGNYNGPRMLMDWDEIRRLTQKGFEIGSHTISHIPLTDLDDQSAEYEIYHSKKHISEKISHNVKGFCYPRGACSGKHAEMIAKSGYTYAVSTKFGSNIVESNIYHLHRRNIADYPDTRNIIASGFHLLELTGIFDRILLKRRIA